VALFESISRTPTPWVFPEQREDAKFEGVQTILDITPMTYEEWTTYAMRRVEQEEKRGVAVDVRAKQVTAVDREAVRSCVARARNVYEDGDDLTTPEEIGKFIERLDWQRIQQVLFAVRSASALKEGAKNS
jgi:hypothetical protein